MARSTECRFRILSQVGAQTACRILCLNVLVISLCSPAHSVTCSCSSSLSVTGDDLFPARQIVSQEAMGVRCVVAGDLDEDGLPDLVSASSTDNTVAWYRQLSDGNFSGPEGITFASNGARFLALGDIDGDEHLDVTVASYYDHTVGWFKGDGRGNFQTQVIISSSVLNAQGVAVADLDGDGDLDVMTASSGDGLIAWFENLGSGRFCELMRVVDDSAAGARNVVGADLDGDGSVDLVSVSKDSNTVAWYPNINGSAMFPTKHVVSSTAMGAYGIVAVDVNVDGHVDLVVASNADDTVAWYRNTGNGTAFEQIVVYSNADFVLSVFAADLDKDGDMDVASASFFDGAIRWHENLDGAGIEWTTHELYINPEAQAHFVTGVDLDNDGDVELLAGTHAENTVQVFHAVTRCDWGNSSCCLEGTTWNGNLCQPCPTGYYGVSSGSTAICLACPTQTCTVAGAIKLPSTCSVTLQTATCAAHADSFAACDCGVGTYMDLLTTTCVSCPNGQEKSAGPVRTDTDWGDLDGDGVHDLWVGFNQSMCVLVDARVTVGVGWIIAASIVGSVMFLLLCCLCICGSNAAYTSYRDAIASQKAHSKAQLERVLRAVESTQECKFHVCFVRFVDFKRYNKLVPHEQVRDEGKLVSLDTYIMVANFVKRCSTVFISHQWLGHTHPDPDNVHFLAVCAACESVCSRFDIDSEDLYVWIDFASIPQLNVHLKTLSIDSLAVYSSISRFFVIVAPECTHHDSMKVCNEETYQSRGWCRLEQWARMTVGGLTDMYIHCADNTLQAIADKPTWYTMSINVFDADFTVESDKLKLVDTVIGLWWLGRTLRLDGELIRLIEEHKNSVFPKKYFGNLIEMLEVFCDAGAEALDANISQDLKDMWHRVKSLPLNEGRHEV
uniref:Tyrosine-protein kinase ephrin type A/B receptor-like domain-containing protein n=1 Tax=Noctiluca scintillans TaxID=2966 RepID=A0A7S1FAU5_NOCSC|mmetsp:Transcript_48554/g.128713  ORF Transcript_48554/g.128713 Transcript_48554/m.128713 type:complete len:898 (+) Transcript_48554:34-2727(+)